MTAVSWPSGILTISAGDLVLDVAPDVGGSISAFYARAKGRRIDWFYPAGDMALAERDPLGMASFPMVPFCNRIRDGRFTFEGVTVQMPRNTHRSVHTLHGHVWQMPWTVEDSGPDRVELSVEHAPGVWPWRYRARQTYGLTPEALTIRMEVENLDARPMPLGFGHHPFFRRTERATITTEVEAIWCADAEVMPTSLERNEVVSHLARGMVVGARDLDNNYVGWGGTAEIRWPEHGAGLRMSAGEPFGFFVTYTPPDKDVFAIEPVSNCTDWLNLRDLGPEKVGGTVLAPGARAEGSIRFEPFALD